MTAAAAAPKALDKQAPSEGDHLAESGSGRRVTRKAKGTPSELGDPASRVHRRARFRRAVRQKQIADVTLKLVAKYGVHETTISRIAAGVGLSRAALYKFFPNRDAMLAAALDLLVERVPRWVARSSGDDALAHLMDMGRQFEPLGLSHFESFTQPWFQFAAASGTGKLVEQLGRRNLVFVREFADLVEKGKRDGSIRKDAETDVIAWSLMMWAWAGDVARLVGLEQVIGSRILMEIFRRMIGDISTGDAASSCPDGAHDDDVANWRDLNEDAQ